MMWVSFDDSSISVIGKSFYNIWLSEEIAWKIKNFNSYQNINLRDINI
jgi:hypothetical protein